MSSDPNKPGQYPPPQWDSQPQRGAYPVPPHYRVGTSTLATSLSRCGLANVSSQRVLNRATEVLPQHQARWLHYLLLNRAIQICDTEYPPTTCMLPTGPRILERWDNLTWAIRVNRHQGSERPSRVDTVDDARYVGARFILLRVMLMGCRFVARASRHQMTVVVPTVSASSKNASSHQSPPKRKPSYQPTLHTHISATPGLCHPNVVEDRCTPNRGSLLSTGLTDNRWGQWHTTLIIRRLITRSRPLVKIKADHSTMIEVTHSLPMLKIK